MFIDHAVDCGEKKNGLFKWFWKKTWDVLKTENFEMGRGSE